MQVGWFGRYCRVEWLCCRVWFPSVRSGVVWRRGCDVCVCAHARRCVGACAFLQAIAEHPGPAVILALFLPLSYAVPTHVPTILYAVPTLLRPCTSTSPAGCPSFPSPSFSLQGHVRQCS